MRSDLFREAKASLGDQSLVEWMTNDMHMLIPGDTTFDTELALTLAMDQLVDRASTLRYHITVVDDRTTLIGRGAVAITILRDDLTLHIFTR